MNTKSNDHIIAVSIAEEMQKSYLDYAMSVIVSRALPDCRDGFKPVHRRILYAAHELGITHDKPYRKSAKIVGETLSNYHPHGDNPIYLAMVRMAQNFSLRDPLMDGQGNFGSMDGDSPAQMRYTEIRLAQISDWLLKDLEYNTVDLRDNYDGSKKEPTVLPARFPNLLINGANGIAVGMATNIPTHNLGEVIDACIAYIQTPNISPEELLQYVKGPDFPTGGEIIGGARVKQALLTGKASITVRGKVKFEEIAGRNAIVITEIPYQVNKAELIKAIEELSKEKVIDGIIEIRDETNKLGVRVVIELKKESIPEVILNQLYKNTQLQTSFGVNMLALHNGRPLVMGLHAIIATFIEFRKEVVTRRTIYLLKAARDKAHVLIGLAIAVANIDKIIMLIRNSADTNTAKKALLTKPWHAEDIVPLLTLVDDFRNNIRDGYCYLTDEQAKAILEMRLQRLTGLEKKKIDNELANLAKEISEYLKILRNEEKILNIIVAELNEVKEKFTTPRKTAIIHNHVDISDEELIQCEDMVVTITKSGYIKRVPLATYKAQKRGGKGRAGMQMHDDDITLDVIVTNTHASLLFFSNSGKVYKQKVYKLPLAAPQSKGRALINILQMSTDEKVASVMVMPDDEALWHDSYIIFATARGNIRRNELADFVQIPSNGKLAIKMDEGDKLVGVVVCNENNHILLATQHGKAIRFPVNAVRVFKSRTSDGVRAIKLAKINDYVISISVLIATEIDQSKRDLYLKIPAEKRIELANTPPNLSLHWLIQELNIDNLTQEEVIFFAKHEEFLLVVTENGFGKLTSAYEYRVTDRGGQGIMNIDTNNDRNGYVISTFPVKISDDIMLVTDSGIIIRVNASSIRISGRNTMGVKIISIPDGEKVSAVSRVHDADYDIGNNQAIV